jgi:hypothetical protein
VSLRRAALTLALNTVINTAAPGLVTLVTFIAHYYLTGRPLTSGEAFTTLALFNGCRHPLAVLPIAVTKQLCQCTLYELTKLKKNLLKG